MAAGPARKVRRDDKCRETPEGRAAALAYGPHMLHSRWRFINTGPGTNMACAKRSETGKKGSGMGDDRIGLTG